MLGLREGEGIFYKNRGDKKMKVYGSQPPTGKEIVNISTQKLDKNQAVEKTKSLEGEKQKVQVTDKVNLSGKAKEIAKLKEFINQLPDIRTERVEALRKAIETGTYRVDSFKVAEKMLSEEL